MSEQTTPLLQIGGARPLTLPLVQAGPPPAERARLERRARLLAWVGIGWHVVEALIAVIAGAVAGSIALVGFGADSMIEAIAGFVVIWLFTGSRLGSSHAERRAQQMIAISFYILAAYVGVEATRTLINASHPQTSWVGIALAAFTAVTMPLLAQGEAPRRRAAELLRGRQGSITDEPLRVSLGRAPDRTRDERAVRLVVGRSARRACDRRRRAQGGPGELARRGLRRRMLLIEVLEVRQGRTGTLRRQKLASHPQLT